MPVDFDAVVAGGGLAGAGAAIALARLGRRVLLVDDAPEGFKIGEALPPAARPLLRDLGVLDRFLAGGHLPSYGNLSVWGSDDPHITDFVFNPHGHGWHLDRVRFDAMLREEAGRRGAAVLAGHRLASAGRGGGGWRVTVRPDTGDGHPREGSSAWLVDATGRRSALARRAGALRIHDDRPHRR